MAEEERRRRAEESIEWRAREFETRKTEEEVREAPLPPIETRRFSGVAAIMRVFMSVRVRGFDLGQRVKVL